MLRTDAIKKKIQTETLKLLELNSDLVKSTFFEIKNLKSFRVQSVSEYDDNDYFTYYKISEINEIEVSSLPTMLDEKDEDLIKLQKLLKMDEDGLLRLNSLVTEWLSDSYLARNANRKITVEG
jgi:predicted ATP-grasp superfamily ATP-dependent carboligase